MQHERGDVPGPTTKTGANAPVVRSGDQAPAGEPAATQTPVPQAPLGYDEGPTEPGNPPKPTSDVLPRHLESERESHGR